MRRPLLLFLFALSIVIVVLHYLDPLGLRSVLLPSGKLPEKAGRVCSAEGIVTKVSVREKYAAVTVRTGGESLLVRLKVSGQDLKVYDLVGRTVKARGMLTLPDGRRNPGCFDYRLYLKGRRIFTIMDVSRYRFEAGDVKRPLLHFLSLKKGQFFEAVRPLMDERSFQIMAGLMFGETGYMDEDLYEEFRLNGISHVLAVSGLHVGLLYAVVLKLLGDKRSARTTALILFMLFVYAALSNFSVSVLRASFMICVHLLSWHLKRRYDMVCAASLCAVVFLLANPYQLFDTGFQLSFAAAYSMGIALPWATSKGIELSDKYKKKWILHAFEIFSPCVMVQLGMTPLIMFHYLMFSPVSLLLNPLAVVLAGLLLPAGLASFAVSFLFRGIILTGAAGVARGFAKLLELLSAAGSFTELSGYCPAPPFPMLLLYYLLFFWFFSETRVVLRRRSLHGALLGINLGLMAAAVTMPLALGISSSMLPWRYESPAVTFVDVGQGDCIHIRAGGCNVLIDGGGSAFGNIAEDKLRPYLLKNGVSHIDLAIITHEDTDHSLGIYQLQEVFDIRQLAVLGKTNEDCGILMTEAGGIKVLLMADADIAREEELCRLYGNALSCDVLKVGHHGSAYSTGELLLKYARPSFAVISCGKNNMYGHPADRVIELLEKSGIIYARTDESGAVSYAGASGGTLIFENAAKDRKWLIQENR